MWDSIESFLKEHQSPRSLQVLLKEVPDSKSFDEAAFTDRLKKLHRTTADGRVEFDKESLANSPLGMIRWGDHAVFAVGFKNQMPADAVARCVEFAMYGPDMKQVAPQHAAHVVLYYVGKDSDPLNQYCALAMAAALFAPLGATFVCNETAQNSFPAAVFQEMQAHGDIDGSLREMPMLYLFCGFCHYQIKNDRGIWMRTFGAEAFGVPNLVMRADSFADGNGIIATFNNMLSYMVDNKRVMNPGDTCQSAATGEMLQVRNAHEVEKFPDAPGTLLFLEKQLIQRSSFLWKP